MRVLTTFGCLLLLTACGGGASPPGTPAAATTSPPAPAAERAPASPEPESDPPAPRPEPSEMSCDDRADPLAPLVLTPEQWNARRGAGVTKLSELNTSREDPAQACMPAQSYRWLAQLTCDDGSHPLKTPEEASRARIGNVGPGGKCGNIVDQYEVSCPEGDVQVFIDMYWCTEALLAERDQPKGA